MVSFIVIGVVMVLAAVALVVMPLFRNPVERAPVAGLAAAIALPAAALLLYVSLSSYPWQQPAAAPPAADSDLTAAIAELEQRVAQEPDAAGVWVTLGQRYVQAERYADARRAFGRVSELEPNNLAARLATAEADILLDTTALAGEPGRVVEEVLVAEPDNAKALWYGAMVALGRGATDLAKQRWERLLTLGPPEPVQQIIRAQLAQLGAAEGPSAAGEPATAMRLEVRLSVSPQLSDRVRSGAPVFLIARRPGSGGPPLAVVRHEAAALPTTVAISDADLMLPGQTLADLAEISLTARVANGGEPQARSGDVFGEILWTRGGNAPLEITMDRVVP